MEIWSCTRSRIRPWHLLAQNSINSSKPQEAPQSIQASCNSRTDLPAISLEAPSCTHARCKPILKRQCGQVKLEQCPKRSPFSVPNVWRTLSSETQPRAGPSSPWQGDSDLGTPHPTQRTATGASSALLRGHFLSVTCPKPCAPAQQSGGATGELNDPAGGGDLPRSAEQSARACLELNSKSFSKSGDDGPWPTPASPAASGKAGHLPRFQHNT